MGDRRQMLSDRKPAKWSSILAGSFSAFAILRLRRGSWFMWSYLVKNGSTTPHRISRLENISPRDQRDSNLKSRSDVSLAGDCSAWCLSTTLANFPILHYPAFTGSEKETLQLSPRQHRFPGTWDCTNEGITTLWLASSMERVPWMRYNYRYRCCSGKEWDIYISFLSLSSDIEKTHIYFILSDSWYQ